MFRRSFADLSVGADFYTQWSFNSPIVTSGLQLVFDTNAFSVTSSGPSIPRKRYVNVGSLDATQS